MKTLLTERLLLEPWDESVRDAWIALNTDERVTSWLGAGAPIPLPYIEDEFDTMLQQWRDRGFGWRSVIDKASGSWIGAAGLNVVGENPAGLPPDEIEIGWWLQPEYWGSGYATEAALATRDEGFEEGFVDHFWARHNARNPASGRIMEKIGMTFVRDGAGVERVPIRIWAMSREQWLKLKRTSTFRD